MPEVRIDGAGGAIKVARLGVAALFAAVLSATGASAQIPSGYSGSSSLTTIDDAEAWRTLTAFGNCYAQRNFPDAIALLATEPGSQNEAATFRRLFRLETVVCLGEGTELSMPIPFIRGAIAEGMYRRRVALPENLSLPPLPAGTEIRTLGQAARCYIADHREQARALIEGTAPGSRAEYQALGPMIADFFRCVPEVARGRSFDATLLRYRLAEALFRTGAASAAAAAGPR